MKRIVVLISNKGTGTNLQAIIDGVESGQINAQVVAVISDTEEALGLQRAKKHHLPIEICPKKEDLLFLLKNPDTIDGVVNNPDDTDALWNRGKMTDKAIQNFFDNKATYAGCTNHFLSYEFDFGPVLGRCFEKILPNDTVDSLYTRLKKKENDLYVKVLHKLCKS
ncbi:MAG: Folate-dependent phosphoribosylglycinamide formyltransferase PurN [Candidatus Curtissbacteria bacterium GW2011_GWA2_41_24]|uniref:phosphoribosylglycinamide formyltransferase 1 n=1 Tax=Candidatus Curtissbacteria bacterium GW2011_GWA2_41_24 TaxID=1618411 RepID=A0A0G0VW37_9BACT|nr:MAG: Folate-dependent phosphoribosylglycinamide formyltransferase PurN [Candidatus Curtissbacteria bacterium GW2011_GWA2_41_24]